jgi:hypothetical protein
MDTVIDTLEDELILARAEEAEALRRAVHLRAIGSPAELNAAMGDVDVCRSRVVQLIMKMRAGREQSPR